MLLQRAAGWALIIAFGLVLLAAMATIGSCETDCGDNGGRGAFLGVMAATPLAILGALLVSRGRSGRLPELLRTLSAAGAVLLGALAIWLLFHGADRLVAGITGTELHGPMNDLAQARANEREAGIVSGIAGLVVAALATTAFLPHLAASGSPAARRWTRGILVLLACLIAAGLALAAALMLAH